MQTLLQYKSKKYYMFWKCVWSLSYPTSKALSPYCSLWLVQLYYTFQFYLINSRNFWGERQRERYVDFEYLYVVVWYTPLKELLFKHFQLSSTAKKTQEFSNWNCVHTVVRGLTSTYVVTQCRSCHFYPRNS